MNIRKGVFFCVSMMIGGLIASAQNINQAMLEIKNIKSQPDVYIYAEATSQTMEEALDNAKYMLGLNIETWVKQNDANDVTGCIAKAQNHIFKIQSMRGDRYRVFVYVKKDDLMAYTSKDQLVVVPMNNIDTPHVNLVSIQDNEQLSSSFMDEEHHDFPDANISKQDTTTLENDVQKSSESAIIKDMFSVEETSQIQGFIKQYEALNLIQQFGRYKNLPQDHNCYLFVYSKDYRIVAYLYKRDNEYINLQTHSIDNILNYRGCGAIWFVLNEK